MSPEQDINTYIGSLIHDINSSLKCNHALHAQSKIHKHRLSMRHVRARSRSIGARLNDLPVIYTGKVSEQALIEKYNNGARWSVEHQYPRQVAGYDLYFWAIGCKSYTDKKIPMLIEKLTYCRMVNLTTPQENRDLYKFQLYGTFKSPEIAYVEAGVVLLDWPKHTKICYLPTMYPHLIPHLNIA